MAELGEEGKDLQNNVAIGMLEELKKSEKISTEKSDLVKKQFIKLHETIVQTFRNHKILWTKAKKMKTDLANQKISLEQAQNKQMECQSNAEQIHGQLKKAEAESEISEHRIEVLQYQLEDLKNEKNDKEARIQKEKKEASKKIQPEVDRLNQEIQTSKEDQIKKLQQIEQEDKHLKEKQERIDKKQVENEEFSNEIQQLHDKVLQIKEEPYRFKRTADNLGEANNKMVQEVQEKKEEVTKKEKKVEEQKREVEDLEAKVKIVDDVVKNDKKRCDDLHNNQQKNQEICNSLRAEINDCKTERARNEVDIKTLEMEQRRLGDDANRMEKQIDHEKKMVKKEESNKNKLKLEMRELEIIIDKAGKEEQLIKEQIAKMEEERSNMDDEIKLTEGKRRYVESKTVEKSNKKESIVENIKEIEKEILNLQSIEVTAQKTVKNLTAMRESMARKASSAMNEVRETREELKIKELLILDLRKKQQETEFKLNNYKNLYEEVKSARNKYVNMIQSSSQDLAELKEEIKIIQNELEILKNESAEKDRMLIEYKHMLQVEVQKRDRNHSKLNKLEFLKKQKKELVDQNINEIEKLLMIIQSLEQEMLRLRKSYENACESRNYTGIQLIDRNDELCILYEKSNIQENILKNGDSEITKLDDEIRMIKIEINETKRQIEISRKNIPVVPKLADEVVNLKNQLELEKDREAELADELENPENETRWRQLEGEDSEPEALDAKIQVLEERLNQKKEGLLEKELILDEITNLSEKLRKQAIDGRQATLQLTEKVNDYQARLKDVTRKMMATLSELSMFQATALKLQNERADLDRIVTNARARFEQTLPPLPDTEIEYLKMVRDQKQYEENREKRRQEKLIEQTIPPFATKTTASQRVNAYIPDEIGLPQPYGVHAPFKPSEVGVNIRHIRKPEKKEVEV